MYEGLTTAVEAISVVSLVTLASVALSIGNAGSVFAAFVSEAGANFYAQFSISLVSLVACADWFVVEHAARSVLMAWRGFAWVN